MNPIYYSNRSIKIFLGIILSLLLINCGGSSNNKSTSSISASSSVANSSSANSQYQVQYNSSEGGTIEGESLQVIESGHSTLSVTAKASDGYHFSHWSDGTTSATRHENNVSSALILTAFFSPYESVFHSDALWIHQDAILGKTIISWPNIHVDSAVTLNIAESAQDLLAGSYVFTQATDLDQLALTELTPFKNYYVSLVKNGQVQARRSFYLGELGVNDLPTEFAVSDNGTTYLSGKFTAAQFQYDQHGLFTLDPSTDLNSLPFVMPFINGTVFTSQLDDKGGLYIAGQFTRIGETTVNNLAYVSAEGQVTAISIDDNENIRQLLIDNNNLYILSNSELLPNYNFSEYSTITLVSIPTLTVIGETSIFGEATKIQATSLAIYAIGENIFSLGEPPYPPIPRSSLGTYSKDLQEGGPSDILLNEFISSIASYRDSNGNTKIALGLDNTIYSLDEKTSELKLLYKSYDANNNKFHDLAIVNSTLFGLSFNKKCTVLSHALKCNSEESMSHLVAYDIDKSARAINLDKKLKDIHNIHSTNNGLLLTPSKPLAGIDDLPPQSTSLSNLIFLNPLNGAIKTLPFAGTSIHITTNKDSLMHLVDTNGIALAAGLNYEGNLIAISPDKKSVVASIDIEGYGINTIALDKDKLYIGGNFNKVNGKKRESLAALSHDLQLLPWPNQQQVLLQKNTFHTSTPIINSIDINHSGTYIGGNFSVQSGPQKNLIKLNANGELLPFPAVVNDTINVIKSSDDTVYLGGYFSQLNNTSQYIFGAINHQGESIPTNGLLYPQTNPLYATNIFYWIDDILVDDNIIYTGGQIELPGHRSVVSFTKSWELLPWVPEINIGDIISLPPFPSTSDNVVESIATNNGYIYLQGNLLVNGAYSAASSLAIYDLQSNLIWDTNTLENIRQVKKYNDNIYILGKIKQGNHYIYGYSEFDLNSKL